MSYTLIWNYAGKDADGNQETKVVIGHPGTFSASDAEARDEGRRIMEDDQIEQSDRDALTPLAVVEVNEDIGDDIQEQCEEVEIGTELLFYDLDAYGRWQRESWWPA